MSSKSLCDKAPRGLRPEMSGKEECMCVCVCFMLFQILLPVMLPSICSLCGSLIRQWAGLRPCLKGWSPGLLAEHLLKDHSTGYIWGGLLSSYWSLPPSLSLYFFSFACPPTPCVCLCLCLYTLNSLPTATSSLLPFCHPLTSSVYSLRSLLPCPSISMLKYQQAQICHSKGPLLFFLLLRESTWKTITDYPLRATSLTDYSLLSKPTLWLVRDGFV